MANSSITNTSQLGTSGVTAGTYGNINQISSISVDATGIITAISNVTPSGALSDITSINGGQIGGFKNVLINGDMQIWQRGTSFATTGVYRYTADRWSINSLASTYTISRQTSGLTGFQYSLRIQRNSGAPVNAGISLGQNVTSNNSIRFQGKNIVMSFWARCGGNFSASGNNLSVNLFTGTGTDQNNQGGGFTGTQTPISTNATLSTSWQYFSFSTSTPVGTGITQIAPYFVFIPTGTAGTNDWYEITGIQIEEGAVASNFEFTDFDTQLTRCEYYFEKSFRYANAPAQNSGDNSFLSPAFVNASTLCYYWVPYKVDKRVAGTVTLFNRDATNAQIRNYSALNDYSGTVVDTSYDKFFTMAGTSSSTTVSTQEIGVGWTVDSDIY